MDRNRRISTRPLVSLDTRRLLGMRQVAGVSTKFEGGADHVEASKLLSKIGTPPETRAETGRLLSKIGEPPETPPATRSDMSRLLSKIGDPPETPPA